MKTKHLVLGATGGIGYAYTRLLMSKGIKTTIFVRDKAKAEKLFGVTPLLEIITGDVRDFKVLRRVARDKDFIFCGINVPYSMWETRFEVLISNVILAAKENNATILFPDNNYVFGAVNKPITEEMVPFPTTRKGIVRLRLINSLKESAEKGICKVIILRLSDFLGPNVTNGLMKLIFQEAVNNKSIKWIINADIPHQFVFTFDAARYFYLLSLEEDLPDYFLVNYGGITVRSIKSLSRKISKIQGKPAKVKVAPEFILKIIALFSSEIRELKENFYQFKESILLDDSKLRKMYPRFSETSLEAALKITLAWYENNMR